MSQDGASRGQCFVGLRTFHHARVVPRKPFFAVGQSGLGFRVSGSGFRVEPKEGDL